MAASRTSFVLASFLVLGVLLVRHHGDAFSVVVTTIPSTATTARTARSGRRRSAPTRLYQAAANGANGSAAASAARAGSQGYSLLRQPVSSWSVEKDPVYVPPKADDSEESLDGWWAGRLQGQSKRSSSSSSILSNVDADTNGDDYSRSRRFITNDGLESTRKTSVVNNDQDDDDDDDEKPVDILQRTYDTLDVPKLRKALFQYCTTVPGRQLVMMESADKDDKKDGQRHYHFLADSVQECQRNFQAIAEWRKLQIDTTIRYRNRSGQLQQQVNNPLDRNSFPLAVLLQLQDEEKTMMLQGEELTLVAAMLDSMEDIVLWREAIRRHTTTTTTTTTNSTTTTTSVLVELTSDIVVNTTLQELLHSAFDESGRLDGTTFPAIGTLRNQLRVQKSTILESVQSLLATSSIQAKLALDSGGPMVSEINGHLVVPVQARYAAAVGIAHDQSRSGKTIFVEPHDIVRPTNDLRALEQELLQYEAETWQWLTYNVWTNRAGLERNLDNIGQLDLVFARSALGERLKGVIPVVHDEGIINVRNARHPILLLRNNVDVIGSDVSLGADGNQGLVLTGPNAGGKTVILKLLGLLALMVRCGIPVPVDAAPHGDDDGAEAPSPPPPRVDYFNPVLADIGDLQSVGGDLSTFSGHMLVCKQVLENSGRNALILMDELGSGTDPNQGVAIAQALLEAVVAVGARVVITTHYLALKQLAAADNRFAVAGMQFVKGKPTYKLLPGMVGESFALAVAERLGLPPQVLARANVLLDSETRKMGDLLREMEDQKALVEQQAEDLANQKQEMARLLAQMDAERIKLEKQQLDARRLEARKFAKLLEEKEQILEDVMQQMKADPSRRILAKSWNDIKLVKRDVLDEAENLPSIIAKKIAAEREDAGELVPIAELRNKPDLKPGDPVVVCQKGPMFGRAGVVKSASGKSIVLKIQNMTLNLKTTDVALPNGSFRSSSSSTSAPKQKNARDRAIEKALADEGAQRRQQRTGDPATQTRSKVLMRTSSNTVDCLGCTLMDAQERILDKFSTSTSGVVYVLHGHGTGGVLKSKIRNWLKSESAVASFQPADASNGGDALTCVVLK